MKAAHDSAIFRTESMKDFARNFWVLVKPAEDVPGQWVGHCLELDIVSVGTSLTHAIEMTAEAACECIADDLSNDRYPLDRRPAPAEFFSELSRLQRDGVFVQANDLPVDPPAIAAVQLKIRMMPVQPIERQQTFAAGGSCFEQLPPAWFMAKQNDAHHMGA